MRTPLVEMLFESGTIHIGRFRCAPWQPEFSTSSVACIWPCVSFPRVPIQFRFGNVSVIGDQSTAVLFSFSQEYRRYEIDAEGSRSVWIEIDPGVLREMLGSFHPSFADLADGRFPFESAPVPPREFMEERVGLRNALAARAATGVPSPEIEERALNLAYGVIQSGFALRGLRARVREDVTSRADIAEHARVVIARRFRESLPLREIAHAVGVSVFHLCRAFRAHTGSSMHSYLNRLRVLSGADSLLDSSDTIAKAALSNGFTSESHFSLRFLREFGMRPGEFRRRAIRGLSLPQQWPPVTPPCGPAWPRSARGL